jgi:ketosteroid isomerase-like protein
MDTQKVTREILSTIQAVNRCYTEGWNEEFRQYVHPDVVAIFPDTPGRLEGMEAYIAEWRGFCEAAVIHDRQETDHRVQIHVGGKAAVVTYLFTVTFTLGSDQKQTMRGRDMFFLVKEGRKWLVAAQQFSAEPVAA